MIDMSASMFGAITALLLPWLLGCTWVYWLLRKTSRRNGFIVAGHGYLVGILITTLTIRAWDMAGLTLSFWPIAILLIILSIAGVLANALTPFVQRQQQTSPSMQLWASSVVAVLVALITLRYATIVQELLLRPLFPWDAWMNWAPKAVVWFEYREMVPFVSANDWLKSAPESLSHIEGALNAWKYPITVPLVQLWGMLGAGTDDHTLPYLPWVFIALAMGMSLYGHLRLAGISVPIATLGSYLFLNLPFVNVHSILAGYADLWVAVTFGCAVLALQEWGKNREWPYAAIALVLAYMCTQLKIPGLIMGGIVVVTLLSSFIHFQRRAILSLAIVAIAAAIYIAVFGIHFNIPKLGEVEIALSSIKLPYIGHFELKYHPIHEAMGKTLFLMINWNILWYLAVATLVFLVIKPTYLHALALDLRALAMTLAFIFFVYYFTERYRFAVDYTQVNRALIYAIPVLVFSLVTLAERARSRFKSEQ